jgi:hypothetical protein
MSNHSRKISLFIYALLLIFTFTTCKKDEPEKAAVRTGNWSGTDISFAVAGNPMKISDLEFNYSGHATGTICSYDYESSASFVHVAGIEGKVFTADINTFNISGTFVSDTIAEIVITWAITDSNCDANYSGSKNYTAKFQKAE